MAEAPKQMVEVECPNCLRPGMADYNPTSETVVVCARPGGPGCGYVYVLMPQGILAEVEARHIAHLKRQNELSKGRIYEVVKESIQIGNHWG